MKGITALLLCRLGLATIKIPSGFRSAKWRKDICPISDDQIKARHAEAIRKLRASKKYGGYDVVCYLTGPQAANILAKKEFVTARRLPVDLTTPSTSSR